jgi:hypothetical protein
MAVEYTAFRVFVDAMPKLNLIFDQLAAKRKVIRI